MGKIKAVKIAGWTVIMGLSPKGDKPLLNLAARIKRKPLFFKCSP